MEVHEALSWDKEKQLSRIHIEADAKLVIQSITGSTLLIHWENKNLIKEIKHLVSSFSYCNFSFVNRDDNQVADHITNSVRGKSSATEAYDNFSADLAFWFMISFIPLI